ncbi:SDR family NAD(P)-dependent oxidoreductase [Dyadobacter subterraneus]|uniref:SDR family oxidoreductase n=2 Tax=Dyadobacter subterraneus TaxID=2773304 RepID=A0ABR9WA18_9BACT|nr:SDR family oxidoreductase [Dyadobacter subterraneus]
MLSDKLDLTGKTAVVTGSSQGIGESIAMTLAEHGASVVLHHHEGLENVEKVKAKIDGQKGYSHIVKADFSKPGSVDTFYDEVFKCVNKVDILVLNASIQISKNWNELTSEDFDIQIEANFKTNLFLMQRFAPAMVERKWGRILTIGSVQQIKPHPAMIAYAATKSAILNVVQNVAMQLADKGVTVNNLAPGVIATPRIAEPVPEGEERILQRLRTPSGQVGEPEDCADLALFLCSEAGRFITGQNIFIDGGMSL